MTIEKNRQILLVNPTLKKTENRKRSPDIKVLII
jgi:hypothetical protein